MFNKEGFNLIEEKYGAEKFFMRLEKECGGHGNGIALVKDNKLCFMHKSVEYSSAKIARQLRRMKWDWCLYHTRVASVGDVSDANCHPYKEGKTILAMNGTESGYSGLAKALNTTDTNAILLSVKKFNLDLFETLKPLSSNFIGFENGLPFATSPNSWKSYDITKNDNGAIVISSSLPSEFEIYEPIGKPFIWTADTKLDVVKKVKKTHSYPINSVVSITKSEATYTKWWREVYDRREDTNDFCCPDCGEVYKSSELIHDMGDKYCPICGEQIKYKDKITYRSSRFLD
jgi:predicted RNA-binding Zn-ribbon protein involved in translation (DUF1610 family)